MEDDEERSSEGDYSNMNENTTESLHVAVDEEDGVVSSETQSLMARQKPSLHEMVAGAVFCALSFLVHLGTPNDRPIPYYQLEDGEYVLDLSKNEEFDGDTVPDVLLGLIAVALPFLIQTALCHFVLHHGLSSSFCCYCVAVGLNALATESTKQYVGYLRPSFYQLCQPSDDYQDCTSDTASDSHKSLPSGHASQSFCGLILLTLFVRNHFGKGPTFRHRLLAIAALLPMALALFIAASRVHDNKHFPADVVGGAVLGGSIGQYVYGIYFYE